MHWTQRRLLAVVFLLAGSFASLAGGQTTPGTSTLQNTPSGAIRGRVVAAESGRTIRGARVTATSSEAGLTRSTISDKDGLYEFSELPAGEYSVTAGAGGYLTMRFGQRAPRDQAVAVQVRDRQSAERTDIRLPRMSIVTGRITDDSGDAIEDVTVFALRRRFWNGRRQLVASGQSTVKTNKEGQYRIQGLAPGTYWIVATTRETKVIQRQGGAMEVGFSPTYYPGTALVSDAKAVAVKAGVDASFIDFPLLPGDTATLSGSAVDATGRPFSSVVLREQIRGEDFSSFLDVRSASVGADGTFALRRVPPGEYELRATRDLGSDHPQIASLPVLVDGVDMPGLMLSGSSGAFVEGRVESEGGATLAIPRMRISAGVEAGDPDSSRGDASGLGWSDVSGDGRFAIAGVFGSSRLRIELPDGWMVKRLTYEGRDISGEEISFRGGEVMSGVRVVISNQVSRVSGSLVDPRGRPITDATVLVFAVDASRWVGETRTVRAVRPDLRGQYHVEGLPRGDYLALAVRYVEDGVWQDPEFLESVRRYAQRLQVTDGTTVALALKVITPDN